jgi:hypothetical protein
MKYKLQLMKDNKIVKEWPIPKIEKKGENVKVKFLPSLSEIKTTIKWDIKNAT